MKQKTKVKKNGKGKRREWMMYTGLIAYIIGLIIRIPLGRMIGDTGMGFLAVGMEVYLLVSLVLTYGISKAVTVLIKYRVKRQMYRSAGRVYRNAMTLMFVLGVLVAAGVLLFSRVIAEKLILEPMGYLAIAAAAPAICLSAIMGVLRGYFQGMGSQMPTVHSRLVEKIVMLAASILFCSIMYTYGLKVADLLRNTEYAAAYGAMGAAFGLSVAGIFGVVHLFFIRMVYAGNYKIQLLQDMSKYAESNGQVISMLFQTAFPYGVCALLYNMNYLVDQRIFNHAMNLLEKSTQRTAHWGIYYGKYSVVIGIAAIICTMMMLPGISKIMQMYERQEKREAQNKLNKAIHGIAILTIPCAVWLAVLAEPITGLLFKADTGIAVQLLQNGSFVVVFFAFAYYFMNIMQRIRKVKVILAGGLLAFVLHLPVLIILLHKTGLGVVAVVYGMLVFWVVACVVGFVGMVRYMQYSPEWFRNFGVTIIAAGVSGLVAMLLCRAILPVIGNIFTLIICLSVSLVLYNVLLLVLKGVHENELTEIPGGKLVAVLAERVNLL